jgi:hypothetical protein
MAGVSLADLQVRLKLEHTSLLLFEPVNASVTIFNGSDYPFVIGKGETNGNARIEFSIEKKRDEVVSRINKRPLVSNFKLRPGEKGETMMDVSSWYDLRAEGRYTVIALAYLNGKAWASNKEIIDVVRGLEITSVTKDVPGYDDMERTYALRYWSREGKEFLFLCVDQENTGVNYGVVQLGQLVRVFIPVLEVDRLGNIKVLHQLSSDCYARSLFKSTRDGVEFVDQTYHLANGDPYPFKGKRSGVSDKSEP